MTEDQKYTLIFEFLRKLAMQGHAHDGEHDTSWHNVRHGVEVEYVVSSVLDYEYIEYTIGWDGKPTIIGKGSEPCVEADYTLGVCNA